MLRCTVAKFTWQLRRIFKAQSREPSLEACAIPPSKSRAFAREVTPMPIVPKRGLHYYRPLSSMSALPPKADMCTALDDVRFVPIADI